MSLRKIKATSKEDSPQKKKKRPRKMQMCPEDGINIHLHFVFLDRDPTT
jgi:hypothetical protein